MDPALFHIGVTFLALRVMILSNTLNGKFVSNAKKCHQEHQSVLDLVLEENVFFVVFFFFLQGLSTESNPSQSSERLSAVSSHFILLSAVSACLKTPQPFCHPAVPDH